MPGKSCSIDLGLRMGELKPVSCLKKGRGRATGKLTQLAMFFLAVLVCTSPLLILGHVTGLVTRPTLENPKDESQGTTPFTGGKAVGPPPVLIDLKKLSPTPSSDRLQDPTLHSERQSTAGGLAPSGQLHIPPAIHSERNQDANLLDKPDTFSAIKPSTQLHGGRKPSKQMRGGCTSAKRINKPKQTPRDGGGTKQDNVSRKGEGNHGLTAPVGQERSLSFAGEQWDVPPRWIQVWVWEENKYVQVGKREQVKSAASLETVRGTSSQAGRHRENGSSVSKGVQAAQPDEQGVQTRADGLQQVSNQQPPRPAQPLQDTQSPFRKDGQPGFALTQSVRESYALRGKSDKYGNQEQSGTQQWGTLSQPTVANQPKTQDQRGVELPTQNTPFVGSSGRSLFQNEQRGDVPLRLNAQKLFVGTKQAKDQHGELVEQQENSIQSQAVRTNQAPDRQQDVKQAKQKTQSVFAGSKLFQGEHLPETKQPKRNRQWQYPGPGLFQDQRWSGIKQKQQKTALKRAGRIRTNQPKTLQRPGVDKPQLASTVQAQSQQPGLKQPQHNTQPQLLGTNRPWDQSKPFDPIAPSIRPNGGLHKGETGKEELTQQANPTVSQGEKLEGLVNTPRGLLHVTLAPVASVPRVFGASHTEAAEGEGAKALADTLVEILAGTPVKRTTELTNKLPEVLRARFRQTTPLTLTDKLPGSLSVSVNTDGTGTKQRKTLSATHLPSVKKASALGGTSPAKDVSQQTDSTQVKNWLGETPGIKTRKLLEVTRVQDPVSSEPVEIRATQGKHGQPTANSKVIGREGTKKLKGDEQQKRGSRLSDEFQHRNNLANQVRQDNRPLTGMKAPDQSNKFEKDPSSKKIQTESSPETQIGSLQENMPVLASEPAGFFQPFKTIPSLISRMFKSIKEHFNGPQQVIPTSPRLNIKIQSSDVPVDRGAWGPFVDPKPGDVPQHPIHSVKVESAAVPAPVTDSVKQESPAVRAESTELQPLGVAVQSVGFPDDSVVENLKDMDEQFQKSMEIIDMMPEFVGILQPGFRPGVPKDSHPADKLSGVKVVSTEFSMDRHPDSKNQNRVGDSSRERFETADLVPAFLDTLPPSPSLKTGDGPKNPGSFRKRSGHMSKIDGRPIDTVVTGDGPKNPGSFRKRSGHMSKIDGRPIDTVVTWKDFLGIGRDMKKSTEKPGAIPPFFPPPAEKAVAGKMGESRSVTTVGKTGQLIGAGGVEKSGESNEATVVQKSGKSDSKTIVEKSGQSYAARTKPLAKISAAYPGDVSVPRTLRKTMRPSASKLDKKVRSKAGNRKNKNKIFSSNCVSKTAQIPSLETFGTETSERLVPANDALKFQTTDTENPLLKLVNFFIRERLQVDFQDFPEEKKLLGLPASETQGETGYGREDGMEKVEAGAVAGGNGDFPPDEPHHRYHRIRRKNGDTAYAGCASEGKSQGASPTVVAGSITGFFLLVFLIFGLVKLIKRIVRERMKPKFQPHLKGNLAPAGVWLQSPTVTSLAGKPEVSKGKNNNNLSNNRATENFKKIGFTLKDLSKLGRKVAKRSKMEDCNQISMGCKTTLKNNANYLAKRGPMVMESDRQTPRSLSPGLGLDRRGHRTLPADFNILDTEGIYEYVPESASDQQSLI